ncbi:unnamed protein product, partial [Adineta steineri]
TRSGYAKWQRCLEHIEQAERQDGIRYDFIVRTRPDLYFAKAMPSPKKLPRDTILINPYYECLNYGISDLFAIIPRALADPYMRVAYIPNLPFK